jgi:type II secretory pathway component PulK
MAISGVVTVSVSFVDTEDGDVLDRQHEIKLLTQDAYTAANVVVITGTVGTSAINIDYAPSTYRNAAGNLVSVTSPSRIAFQASGSNYVDLTTDSSSALLGRSRNNVVSLVETNIVAETHLIAMVVATAGTSSYTAILFR